MNNDAIDFNLTFDSTKVNLNSKVCVAFPDGNTHSLILNLVSEMLTETDIEFKHHLDFENIDSDFNSHLISNNNLIIGALGANGLVHGPIISFSENHNLILENLSEVYLNFEYDSSINVEYNEDIMDDKYSRLEVINNMLYLKHDWNRYVLYDFESINLSQFMIESEIVAAVAIALCLGVEISFIMETLNDFDFKKNNKLSYWESVNYKGIAN